jgi:predicted nucleic acid binding AN1-type Zn finger protein
MKNENNRPLVEGESESLTVGCRHSNPDICAKHSMRGVCAFVTEDSICHAPPFSWKKLYVKLIESKE